MMSNKIAIKALHPLHVNTYGTGYVAYSITRSLRNLGVDSTLFCLSAENELDHSVLRRSFGRVRSKIAYRIHSRSKMVRSIESSFFDSLKNSDIAYLWPGASLELYRAVKERGILIVSERINCHRGTIDSILNQAESGSGIKAARPVSRDRILEESQKMAYADAVFAPSELVGESLIQNGVDRGKILLTSYGIDAQRIRSNISNPTNQKKAVFVGRVGLRKGANLLIDYWRRSNTNSELWFLGKIEPGFSELASKAASDSRIKFKSFVENVDALLKDSSFYVMPSLEEGSPLTTYEAMVSASPLVRQL